MTLLNAGHAALDAATVTPAQAAGTDACIAKLRVGGKHGGSLLRVFLYAARLPLSVILSSITINLLALAMPFVIMRIIDRVVPSQAVGTLYLLVAGLIGLILAEMALRLARNRVVNQTAMNDAYLSHVHAARRLLNSSYSAAVRLPSAIAADSIGAVDDFHKFLNVDVRLAVLDFPFVVLFLAVIWAIGGPIVIVPLTMMIVFAAWAMLSRSAMKKIFSQQMELQRERFSFYAECIKGIATLKSLAVEPQMLRRLERMLRGSAPTEYSLVLETNRTVLAGHFFTGLTIISIAAIGAMMAIYGALSAGTVAACCLIAVRLSQPVLRIASVWRELESAKLALDRAETVMSLPWRGPAQPFPASPAKVQLTGVRMTARGANGREKWRGVNLTIGAGDVIGLIVRDDQERAVFADLLRGRLTPQTGTVRIDGIDPAGAEADTALNDMLYLGSKPAIFKGSIVENMCMFGVVSPAVTMEIARQFGIEPIIQKLPQGYRTRIDDVAARHLPHDIIQAVTMVRAAAIRPRFLVLDIRRLPEDISTRASFHLVQDLRGSSTIIVLARRLREISDVDRAFFLRDWTLSAVDPKLADDPDAEAALEDDFDGG